MELKVSKIGHFSGHKDSIYAMACHSDQKRFYSAGADGWVVEWQTGAEDLGKLIGEVPDANYSCLLDESGNRIITGTRKGDLFVIPFEEGSPRRIEAHQGGVFSIFKLDDSSFLSGGEDGKLLLWDTEFQNRRLLYSCGGSIRQISMCKKRRKVYLASSDNCIHVLSGDKLSKEYHWEAHDNSIFSIVIDSNGEYMYSGGRDAMLRQWEITSGYELKQELPAHMYHLHYLSMHPDEQLLLSSSMDKTVKIWHIPSLKLLKVVDHARYEAHQNSVNKVLWIGPKEFISCSDDRSLQHFKIEDLSP